MEIDIITYTDEQFAALSLSKIEEVRSAQLKKNKLTAKLEEDIAYYKRKLIDQGTYVSGILEKKTTELTEAYESEVEVIREALLFYLHFGRDDGDEGSASDAPYTVDYSLSEEERLAVVKTYYETAYTDASERFTVFSKDTVARTYLGELYASLYHYFEALISA